MTALDHEKLAAAFDALGMEKEAAGILGRLAKRFGGGYARQAAQQGAKAAAGSGGLAKMPGLLGRLGLGGRLALAGAGGLGLYTLEKDRAKREGGGGSSWFPSGGGSGSDSPFSSEERQQFARHGLDPDRLKFMQTLGRLRQGMNLEDQLMGKAMSGRLPPDVLGGSDKEEPENLEAYA